MDLKKEFLNVFKNCHSDEFFSPGRVNLIGEHIDYNGGKVLPCIIDKGTHALVSKRDDKKIFIYSTNFSKDGIREINLNELEPIKGDWLNYIKAVFKYLLEKGLKVSQGLNILIHGTISSGGLSSSASLEILICKILKEIYKLDISDLDLILLSVKVENEYIGVKSGIMDQYSIMMGRKNKATLIDCDAKSHEYIKFDLKDKHLVIMNTNKKRRLEDSKYNERYSECMKGLEILKQYVNINHLCDLTPEEFELNKKYINDEVIKRRVEHVVYENDRVKKAVVALNNDDFDTLYNLMSQSHKSLKELYEVTGLHLDSMVEACNELGIIGARMTGAGFGGNAICIIDDNELNKIDKIKEIYYNKTGIYADITITKVGL